MTAQLLLAPAKLNLNLHITGRQDNGYHLLDSHMIFLKWGDQITIEPSDSLQFHATGPYANIFSGTMASIDNDSPNLIIQAAYTMADAAKRDPCFKIDIEKNIPSGAGLGGGSIDAATVMRAINQIWDEPFTLEELCEIGLNLGAELSVCLHRAASRVQGIGEDISPLSYVPDMAILVTWPEISVSTADVFKSYSETVRNFDPPLEGEPYLDDLQHTYNGLQKTAINLCPVIQTLIDQLQSSKGCELARMTGSGSACFGLFKNVNDATIAARAFDHAIVTNAITPFENV